MFRTRKDSNKNVTDVRIKLNSESERKLRGLNFAKLYFLNKDYRTAEKCMSEYMTVKDNNAGAYKLYGEICESLGDHIKAINLYKRCLELDRNQPDVLMKICQLLPTTTTDSDDLQYWADRCERSFSNSDSVYKLRECIINSKDRSNRMQLEKLVTSTSQNDGFSNHSPNENQSVYGTPQGKYYSPENKLNRTLFSNVVTSPEKVDGQVKSILVAQDELLKKISDQQLSLIDFNHTVMEVLQNNKCTLETLKDEVSKIQEAIEELSITQSNLKDAFDEYIAGDEHDDYNDYPVNLTNEREGHVSIPNNVMVNSVAYNENTSNVFPNHVPNINYHHSHSTNQPINLTANQYEPTSAIVTGQSDNKTSVFARLGQVHDFDDKFVVNHPFQIQLPENNLNEYPRTMYAMPPGCNDTARSLSELFKPASDSWACGVCFVRNNGSTTKCVACESYKTDVEGKSEASTTSPFNSMFTFGGNSITRSSQETPSLQDTAKPLSELFKPAFDSWECEACYVRNDGSTTKCVSCDSNRAAVSNEKSSSLTEIFASKWSSGIGGTHTGQVNSSSGDFTSGKQPTMSFKFGCDASEPSDSESKPVSFFGNGGIDGGKRFVFGSHSASDDAHKSTFQFGSSQDFNFRFGGVKDPPKSPQLDTSPVKQTLNESIETPEPSNADDIHFEPVIPLPPKVDVHTGEEEEVVLFNERAKLFRFVDKEWKERGLGCVKILRKESTNKIRLLMRRDVVHKVCLNHYITTDLKFTRKETKSLEWTATDYSDNEASAEVFAIRFKNQEIRDQFEQIIENAKKGILPKEETTSKPSLNESLETPEPSNADDIHFQPVIPLPPKVEVQTGEEEEIVLFNERAKLFRFVDKEWKERGVGCVKILLRESTNKIRLLMRRDTIHKVCLNHYITTDLKFTRKETKSLEWTATDYSDNEASAQVFAIRFKNQEFRDEFEQAIDDAKSRLEYGLNCEQSNETDEQSTENDEQPSEACEQRCENNDRHDEHDDDIEVVYERKPESSEHLQLVTELLLPLNFYDYEKCEPCPGCIGCTDTIPLHASEVESDGICKSTETEKAETNDLFSDVIKAQGTTMSWSDPSTKPLWLTQKPRLVFGSPTEDCDHDGSVVNSDDIFFQPVIPLPDIIDVKTGEEDEVAVYSQRSKLFRYDSNTKEWKERGLGEFKILKHKEKCRFRLILRREQIFKIACNHYLTPSLTISPMPNSETALCWTAMDYAEEKPASHQFALRFKSKALLNTFLEKIEECKKTLEESMKSDSISATHAN